MGAMRYACVLALALLGLVETASAQPPSDSSFARLDAYLRSELTRLRVPGAAVAVVRGDSLVHAMLFGRRNESGEAITLETPFMIGAISKSLTALAVLQLVDAGHVALDSPVTRYLPWFRPTLGTERRHDRVARVTIRQVLNQNSGIPSYVGRMDWAYPDTTDAALERHARRLATVKLAHPPGMTFEYANANYVLLGEVIQEVTHTSYERYVEEHVFAPLGMTHSFTSQPAADRNAMARGFASWFGRPRAAPELPFIRSDVPASQLIASVADMARYLAVHIQDGRYRGGMLVSSAAMTELHRPVSPLDESWSYAMGWMSGTFDGRTALWHNGLVPNFYAFMALVPERREGIVLLTNVGNVLDLPSLNRSALGTLRQLEGGGAPDPAFCAMCPMAPLVSETHVRALRPLAAGVVLLQCGWIAWSIRQRQWRSRKENIRSVSFALLWAGLWYFAFPLIAQIPPSVMGDVMPDLRAALDASVAIALAWALIRVVARSVGSPDGLTPGRM